ncbi:unnamed protein product [Arctogadus glacialis]
MGPSQRVPCTNKIEVFSFQTATSSVSLAVLFIYFLQEKEGWAAERSETNVVSAKASERAQFTAPLTSCVRGFSFHVTCVTFMVFRHCGDLLSLKVAEGFVNRPLAYDATMLAMLENENISASGTSCLLNKAPLSSFHRNEWAAFFNPLSFLQYVHDFLPSFVTLRK